MKPLKYKSRIDWWVWAILGVLVAVAVLVCIDSEWYVALPICGSVAVFFLLFFGCWYEIDGDELVVYQFFRPHKFPISKISEIKKTIGILATAGMSTRRVSIRFSDRSVLKSTMPLELSPKNRDGFMASLKAINPSIVIEG